MCAIHAKDDFLCPWSLRISDMESESFLLISNFDIEFLHLQGTQKGSTTWHIDNGATDESANIL